MAVTLAGVRLPKIGLERQADGAMRLSGDYELMGSNGKVLATQAINGYGAFQLALSPDAIKAINHLTEVLTTEINALLGLGGPT